MRSYVGVLLLVVLTASRTEALTIQLAGHTAGSPAVMVWDADSSDPLVVTLQVFNEEAMSVGILSWQLGLQLEPGGDSTGGLAFESVSTPSESLFGEIPGPMRASPSSLPSTNLVVTDADLNFIGETIAAQSVANIVELGIAAMPDTSGLFELIMNPFDLALPNQSSSWFPASGIPVPTPFANTGGDKIVLATVNVVNIPEPMSIWLLLAAGLAILKRGFFRQCERGYGAMRPVRMAM